MGKQSRGKKKRTPGQTSNVASGVRLSGWKLSLFAVVAVSGVFIIFEVALNLMGYVPFTASDPYLGFQSRFPLFVETTGPDGAKRLRTAKNKAKLFNAQSFPLKKGASGYRVFTLGGSTTYGRPYFDDTSFTGWLREFLRAADPGKEWELINCGGVSYASYRVATLMEELVRYEPDLFIIYSGHNEFLEKRTYRGIIEEPKAVTTLKLLFGRLRTYSLLRDIKESWTKDERPLSRRAYKLTGEVEPILDDSAGPDIYHRDDKLKGQILAHYRFNLNRMVEMAKTAGADVIFVTTPVNARDFSPFKSQHRPGMDKGMFGDYGERLLLASSEIDDGDFDGAVKMLKKLIAEDNRYALTRFEMGRALMGLEKFDQAGIEFIAAVDEDICPLRALSDMDEIIKDVAKKNRVPVVDFTRVLESLSLKKNGHSILGAEFFLDHVHPTIAANRVLAEELLGLLIRLGTASPKPGWGEETIQEIVKKVEGKIDDKAHARAEKILARVLIWAGKKKEAARFAKSAATLLQDDAESQFHLAFSLEEEGRLEQAVDLYRKAVKLKPDYLLALNNLGILLNRMGKGDEALHILERAAKGHPESAMLLNSLGEALFDSKRFKEAIVSFERSLKLDPGKTFTHSNLGLAYSALSQWDKAIESFSVSLRLAPDDRETRRYLAISLAADGRCDEALPHFEQILRAEPGNKKIAGYISRCKPGKARSR